MSLASPYRLPYRVGHHPEPLFDGQAVELHVILADDATAAAIGELSALVTAFEQLAWIGALAGPALPPWQSSIGPVERLNTTGRRLAWRLEECRFDDRAFVLLAQMFLLTQARAAISDLAVVNLGKTAALLPLRYDPAGGNPYPGAYVLEPTIPDIDPYAGNDVAVIARFARPLTPEEGEKIDVALGTWGAAASMGVYANAPTEPESCGLLPPEHAAIFDDEVEYSLARVRSHPAAFDGISNVLSVFHHTIAPLVELRIE